MSLPAFGLRFLGTVRGLLADTAIQLVKGTTLQKSQEDTVLTLVLTISQTVVISIQVRSQAGRCAFIVIKRSFRALGAV